MYADIPTMFLMIITVGVTLSVVLGIVGRQRQTEGVSLWAMALALNSLGYALLGLRGQISNLLSIVVANVALSGALAMFAEGLFRFQQRPAPRWLVWAPVLVLAMLFILWIDRLPERVVTSSAIFAAQFILILTLLVQERRQTVGQGQYLIGATVLMALATLAYRGISAAFQWGRPGSLLAAGPAQTVTFLLTTVSIVVFGIGLVIMTKERADERNRLLAHRDDMTGLNNRRSVLEALNQQLAQARRSGLPLSLLMIDVDHFKRINDTHGHLSGDLVLKQVAHTLRTRVRSQDIVGRVGGEEFLVVLPNTTATGGRWVAEALRESIAATRCSSLAGKPIPITVSMGLHEFDPRGDRDCDDLINDADQALYRAKAKGRDRVEVFESVEAAPPVTAAMPPTRREAPADQRSNIR